MHEHIKTFYTFEIFSARGVDIVKVETVYKRIWEVENEIEQAFKKKYKIKGSLILNLIETKKIITNK